MKMPGKCDAHVFRTQQIYHNTITCCDIFMYHVIFHKFL